MKFIYEAENEDLIVLSITIDEESTILDASIEVIPSTESVVAHQTVAAPTASVEPVAE